VTLGQGRQLWPERFFAQPALAGFLMIGLTARKQGLHDLISGSLVVIKH